MTQTCMPVVFSFVSFCIILIYTSFFNGMSIIIVGNSGCLLFGATHSLPLHMAMVATSIAVFKFKDCGTIMTDSENIIIFRRVIFTLSHTSLVPRPEFKLEWVLWRPWLVKIVPYFDLEINLLISLWFVCFHRVAWWFSPSTSASSTIITDFPVSYTLPWAVLGGDCSGGGIIL